MKKYQCTGKKSEKIVIKRVMYKLISHFGPFLVNFGSKWREFRSNVQIKQFSGVYINDKSFFVPFSVNFLIIQTLKAA